MTLRERILDLAATEDTLTPSNVSMALGIHRVSAKGHLNQMVREGALVRTKPGRYALPVPDAVTGNTIGRAVPEGTFTRQQAAEKVDRSTDTLIRWQRQGLCVPSRSMQAGRLRVWLYTDEDIERMKEFASTRKPGPRPKHRQRTAPLDDGPLTATYSVVVYLNEDAAMSRPYEPGDRIGWVGEYTVTQVGSSRPAMMVRAAEQMWEIGNRMQNDADQQEWPGYLRSMCVGDVLCVLEVGDGDHRDTEWFTADVEGWTVIPLPVPGSHNARMTNRVGGCRASITEPLDGPRTGGVGSRHGDRGVDLRSSSTTTTLIGVYRTMSTIRGGRVKSLAGLKASLKKGGGSSYLFRVPNDATVLVRFLTEPYGDDAWVDYHEHYDDVRKFYPCITDNCPGCAAGDRPSKRYLANVLDVGENKVVPLVMPLTMAISVEKKYEKYGTLLDRDYELERSGQGFDTSYEVTPEPPSKINLKRYELLDLWELLKSQLAMADDAEDDDDEDDDEGEDDLAVIQKAAKKRKVKPAPVEDEDEDDEEKPVARKRKPTAKPQDEEEEADEDDEPAALTRDSLEGKGLRELKAVAKAQGYSPADTKGLDVDAIIDLIVGDDEDEDDEEEITESELRVMSLGQVKKVATELGIKVKAGTPKGDIIELILANADPGF